VLDLVRGCYSSIVSKEWLFRITRKVADRENSPVLLANAHYYQSDAYSSLVALVAILGSGWHPAYAYITSLHSRHLSLLIFLFFLDRIFGSIVILNKASQNMGVHFMK
jgi:divalent metal cation (Fe/Co/Zn/Cd) transporter